jgi:DHA2 family multidrug resistance protein
MWRSDGAGVYTLTRNIGASVGIASLQALQINKSITVHADLSGKVLPGSPQLSGLPIDLTTASGIDRIDVEVARQAAMVAYVNVFHLMTMICLLAVPLLLMVHSPKASPTAERDPEPHLAVE